MSWLWIAAANAGGSMLILSIVYMPLERLKPIAHRKLWRRGLGTDTCFMLGNFLLWTPIINLALVWSLTALMNTLPDTGMQEILSLLSLVLQIMFALVISDCCTYWYHRLSHRIPLLWRFHQTHHSATAVDWVAAYREHPVDNFLTRLVENAPLVLLGIPLEWIAGIVVFRGLWALYIHANIALDPGPLRYLLGSPRLHHWHHEQQCGGQSNYANLNPLMDVLFGTYHDPKGYPIRTGVDQHDKRGYVFHLLRPLRLVKQRHSHTLQTKEPQ